MTNSFRNVPFEKELEALTNKHSLENESNTPDWILAQYLIGCLSAFTRATQQRESWYGRDPRPSEVESMKAGFKLFKKFNKFMLNIFKS